MNQRYTGFAKWQDPDAFYESLIDAHQGLSVEQSHRLNASLVLMLANEVADNDMLRQILKACRQNLDGQQAGMFHDIQKP